MRAIEKTNRAVGAGQFAGLVAVALCLAWLPAGTVRAASAKEINIKADAALERFHKAVDGADAFLRAAKGVLIFPDIVEGGFFFGGQFGEGVLRQQDKPIAYYRTTGISVGFQAGAQSKSVILLFMTQQALDNFLASNGWRAGVNGSIAVIELGVGGRVDNDTIKDPIIGFVFGNKGLMAGVSLEGSKFTRLAK